MGWRDLAQSGAGIKLPFVETALIVLGIAFAGLLMALVTTAFYGEMVTPLFIRLSILHIAGVALALGLLAAVARLRWASAPLSDPWQKVALRFIPLYLAPGILGGLMADGLYHLVPPQGADLGCTPLHLISVVAMTCAVMLVAGAIATAIALHRAETYRRLRLLAARDSLTRLYNRVEFHARLQAEVSQARRYQRKCSLLFLDVDGFKAANEHFGHLRGDELLRASARFLERNVRASDTVGRYGGDEFAIILPQTDGDQAMVLARRLQQGFAQALSQFPWLAELPHRLTLSIGVGTFPEDAPGYEQLITAADQATFLAKLVGGNTVQRYDRWPERLERDPGKLPALLEKASLGAVEAVASAIDALDPTSSGHSRRVGRYAEAIAREMGLDDDEVERVRIAGLLHDLGKVGIADAVLTKPGRLSPEEQQEVRGHVSLSVSLLQGIAFLQDKLAMIASHHENFDGSGYPGGRAGVEIPLGARILRLADSFEAMTRERRYGKRLTPEEALEEIKQLSGSYYDPRVVSALESSLKK